MGGLQIYISCMKIENLFVKFNNDDGKVCKNLQILFKNPTFLTPSMMLLIVISQHVVRSKIEANFKQFVFGIKAVSLEHTLRLAK